jgi:hypothetical protein
MFSSCDGYAAEIQRLGQLAEKIATPLSDDCDPRLALFDEPPMQRPTKNPQ